MKKIFALFTVIFLVSILVTSCAPKQVSNIKIADGLYIANWYGYTGIADNENASVNLPFISIHSSNSKVSSPDTSYNSNEYGLLMNGKIFTAPNLISWRTGKAYKEYTFYTLIITLPKLKKGVYNVTEIKIPVGGKELYYPIHWIVDVRSAKEVGKCLKVTGQSGLSGSVLTGVDFKVKNSCNSPVVIDNVQFKLPGYNVKPTMFVAKDETYENQKKASLPTSENIKRVNEVIIRGSQERWVRIKLNAENENLPDFVSIKPFIAYHASKSSTEKLSEFYSQSVFSKFPQNKEEVEKLLLSDFVKGKNMP